MGRLSNDPTVVDGNTDLTTNKLTAESATDMSSGSFSGSHHETGDTSMDDRAKAARDQILGVLFDEQEAEETANTNMVVSSREEDDHNLKQAEKQQAQAKHGGAATLYQQQAKLEPKDKTSSAASNHKTRHPPAELSASARAMELQERVLSLVLSEEFHFGGEGDNDDDEDVDVFDDMDKAKAKLDKAYKTNGNSSSEKKMAAAPKKKTHRAKTAAKTGAQEGNGNAKEKAKENEKAAVGIRMDAEEGAAFTPPMPLPHLAEQASSASSARVASESTLPGAVAIRGSRTERLGFGILTSQHNRGNTNNNSNSNPSFGSLAEDNDDDVTFTYNDLEAGQGRPAPGPEQSRSGTSGSRDQHAVSSASATEQEQGLAQAHLVNEEDDQPIANADPVDMNAPRRQRTTSSQKTAQAKQEQTTQYGLLAIFLCGVVVVATMMGIVFGTDAMNSNAANSNGTSNSTAVMMTAAPTPDPLELAKELGLPDYTLQSIQEEDDQPAAKAYQWLLEDVAAANNSMPAWRQVQRFTLALVYHALGGDAWNAKEGWLEHTADECRDWFFRKVIASAPQMGKAVIFVHESETNQTELIESPCDEEGRFTHLAFAGSNLVGAIPREIALLTSLTYLDVSANTITGSLPTEMAFLTNLERLFANRNFISGSIPTEVGLLTSLEMFDVGNNQNFEGPIPSEFGLLSNSLTIFSTQRSHGTVPVDQFGRVLDPSIIEHDGWHS